jgi:Fe2+ transport system protein FeoA
VHDLIPLNLLSCGQMGVVDQVVGHPEQVHQLEERGLRGGTEVEVLGRNGDTCMIRLITGATIGIRTNQGTAILVRLRASA